MEQELKKKTGSSSGGVDPGKRGFGEGCFGGGLRRGKVTEFFLCSFFGLRKI